MVARITPTLGACSGSPRVDSQQPKQLRAERLKAHISSRGAYNKTTRLKHRSFACLDHFRSKSDKRLFNMAKQPSYEGQPNPPTPR